MIAKFFSYFLPINVIKRKSSISNSIEVTWNNGELVIDSKNTNYSYGSLQRILKKGLKYIGYDRIKTFEKILVLGVAGGSVIKTLVNDIKYKGEIIGVEIDPEIIEIANTYFNIDQIKNLEIINEDAFEYVLKSKDQFDLIIIDIFQDTTMPSFLFEAHFIQRVNSMLNINGFILFNTMVISEKNRIRNLDYRKNFDDKYSLRMYPKVEVHNELFTIKKLK